MSFTNFKEFVEVGDRVIIFVGYDSMSSGILKKNTVIHTKRGSVRASDLLGVRYGSQVRLRYGGYVHVLAPTPELWTLTLPHRTQIVYTPDISVCLLQLELGPGSVVVESGTGSGSMSHAILRTIAPTGHLHTFEFHEGRAERAREEFADHGLSELVTVYHRDACEQGFELSDVADAVFLDLPKPWLALESAKEALKSRGGRLCSFSPCIEQVQRTCLRLHELGFSQLHTVECLSRSYEVRKATTVPLADLGSAHLTTDLSVEQQPAKRRRSEDVGEEPAVQSEQAESGGEKRRRNVPAFPHTQLMCAVPPQVMAGHTAFLTFASLPPSTMSAS